jgi:hypothetical protein
MKKIKRAFALALASAMILGMFSMTASADESANLTGSTDNPIESIPVHKIVNCTKGAALPDVKFYLQMAPAEDLTGEEKVGGTLDETTNEVKNATTVQKGIELSNPIVTFEFDSSSRTLTGEAEADGAFNIKSFTGTFPSSGVYRYYITEVVQDSEAGTYRNVQASDNAKSYITYDTSKYIVDLYVSTKGDSYVVTGVAVQKEGLEKKPEQIDFSNSINVSTITITKQTSGALYTSNEKFKFHILIPEGGDTITLTGQDTLQAVVKDTKNNTLRSYTLKVAGDNIDADMETYGTYFELGSNETLEITAPVTMIYKVHEEDYSSEGYTTEASYDVDNGTEAILKNKDGLDKTYTEQVTVNGTETNCVTVRGTTNKGSNTVIFTNTRHEPEVGTGINLDFIPYVVVLALVVAAGSVLLVYKKKKTVR